MIIGKICVGLTNVQHFTVFPLTEGLVGAEIEIEYTHPVWKQLRKLVTFRAGKVIKSTWDERGVVKIPWEVLEKAGKTLHVGITGTSVSNEIIVPTIQFSFDQPIQPSMEPGAESGADPTLPIWAQLDARLKELEEHDDEIDEERLEEVVNDALKKAKENGDFTGPPGPVGPHGPQGDQGPKGEDGKSPTITLSDFSNSTGSGIYIEVKNPDGSGQIYLVYNGRDGTDGITPHIGANGNWFIGESDTGKPSRGVEGQSGTSVTVSTVSESPASGGTNVVTFTDGKKVNIKNGNDGRTPEKGKDYFTEDDISDMVSSVVSALPVYKGEVAAE